MKNLKPTRTEDAGQKELDLEVDCNPIEVSQMDELSLIADLYRDARRQGPGGEDETRWALKLAGVDCSRSLKIADIGCGTGASTLILAKDLDAKITAVDFLPEFLEKLRSQAHEFGVSDKITTMNSSMENLPFTEDEYDVIWSEGAIYNMGFEVGITAWGHFLKPGGKLVVSEITWLTAIRPSALQAYWEGEYPEIDVASAKIEKLERNGYSLKAFFVLPTHCWIENYFEPLASRFDVFLDRHGHCEQAEKIVEAEEREIELYSRYGTYYGYGVYIAEKTKGER